MKKFSFLMAVALLLMGHAYVYGAQLNPYAYDVKAQLSGTNIELSYKLNAPATSTDIIVYCNDVEIGRQQITEAAANTVGSHAATIDLSAFNQAGNCTVGIKVNGNSPAQPTQLTNGTSAVTYSLYHPKGVAIDKNPASPNFGRILTDECMLHSKSSGYISCPEKNGIYAFDPAFQQIHNGSGYAFKGGLTYTAKMTDSSTNAYAPYRIRISQSGRIFVTMQDDHHGLIYEASADLQTFTPIVSNYTINGRQAMNASLDLKDNQDGSISLLALNCNSRGIGFNNTGWELTEFTVAVDGTISSRVVMDSAAIISVIGFQKNVDPIEGTDPAGNHWRTVLTASNTQFQYAADGGYWYINSRSDAYQATFGHIKANGTWDLVMSKLDLTTTGTSDFYGGAGLIEIGDKIYVGMNPSGTIGIFTVDYTGANTTITNDGSITVQKISRNINDMAYDPAYNLYAVGNSGEKIIAVALPYSGQVETPVVLPSNVVLPLNEHLYEIGSNNNWATNEGVEMDIVAPNVFEKEITFADATSYFTLSSALGADWDAINAYRYGADNNNEPISNGLVKSLHLGWGNSFAIPAGKYRITADLNALTVTVKQLWDNIYMFNNITGEWVLGDGVALTKTAENVFELDECEIPEGKYVIFSTTHGADWANVNAGRLYPESFGSFWVDGDGYASISATPDDDKTLLIKAGGKYAFTIDLNEGKIFYTQLTAKVSFDSEIGYATYYNSKKGYTMPANVTGYAFNYPGAGLTQAFEAGDDVPAGVALVLAGPAGTFDLVLKTGVPAVDLANQLRGTDVDELTTAPTADEYLFYGLSLAAPEPGLLPDPTTVGFYWMAQDGGAFPNKAHKAYLALMENVFDPAFLAPAILFNENNATNIENIEGQEKAVKFIQNGQLYIQKNGVVYDAMGRVIR